MARTKRKITKEEVKTRFGYVLFGFFAFLMISPARDSVQATLENLNISPVLLGAVGIVSVLYYFDL